MCTHIPQKNKVVKHLEEHIRKSDALGTSLKLDSDGKKPEILQDTIPTADGRNFTGLDVVHKSVMKELQSCATDATVIKEEPQEYPQHEHPCVTLVEASEKLATKLNQLNPESLIEAVESCNVGKTSMITEILVMDNLDTKRIKLEEKDVNISQPTQKSLQHYKLRIGKHSQYFSKGVIGGTERNLLQCNFCEDKTQTCHQFQNHIKSKHMQRLFPCHPCNALFLSNKKFKKHLQRSCITHNSRLYKCSVCSYSSKLSYLIRRHERLIHNIKKRSCKYCDFNCNTYRAMNLHCFELHKDEPEIEKKMSLGKCHICDKIFSSFSELDIHMKVHTGDRPFACSLCDYKAALAISLQGHVDRRHKKSLRLKPIVGPKYVHLKHSCTLCEFKSSNVRNLDKHYVLEHKVKRYKCEKCLSEFGSWKVFDAHKFNGKCNAPRAILLENGAAKCPKCGRTFLRRTNAEKHIAKDLCQKPMVAKDNAKVRVAPDFMIYQCNACNEQFPKRKVLDKHRKYCVFRNC